MTAYIIRRLLLLPLIIFGVTLIVFSMMQLLGEDQLLAAYVDPNTLDKMSEADLEAIKEKYGLNEDPFTRYVKWIESVAHGDLGWSIVGKEPVKDAIIHRLPSTVELALYAIIPIIGVGIWLGVQAALHHNKWQDHLIRIFSIVGVLRQYLLVMFFYQVSILQDKLHQFYMHVDVL
jgi:peptide/nickel transport system permease protein